VYAKTTKTTKSDAGFFVRISNTTRMLEGPHIPSYIDGHWPK